MNKFNDGGPAFPVPPSFWDQAIESMAISEQGMSLHQYFAGQAMQANVARGGYDKFSHIAIDSLAAADAMVAAYEKREKMGDNKSSITPDMSTLRRAFEVGTDFEYANPRDTKPGGEDEAFENFVKSLLADGMKIKTGTIEVQTAPQLRKAFEAGMFLVDGGASSNFTEKEVDDAFEDCVQSLLKSGEKIKVGTIEVATAPKGAYEALVYSLAKLLGCSENENAIINEIHNLFARSIGATEAISK